MTSAVQPVPDDPTPEGPTTPTVLTVVPGGSASERAAALLRVRPYRRLWRAQLLGSVGDRLGLLVLLVLVVQAGATGEFGTGYRAALLVIAAAFALRLLTSLLLGVALLHPLSRLLDRLDRRWTLVGVDVLRAALFVAAPFWIVWDHGTSAVWLMITIFATTAAERVAALAREAVGGRLLPAPAPGVPAVDQRPVLRHLDQWTGYAAMPLAAGLLVLLTLIENGVSSGVGWLDAHAGTVAAFGAAALLLVAAVLHYLQELPPAPGPSNPWSPLSGLRAPTDIAPGNAAPGKSAAAPRGRTGSSVAFSFSAAGAVAAMAGSVAVAYPHAADLWAGPVGFGLLVLAATAAPVLGLRIAASVLPVLSRRRLLPLALGTAGLSLLLSGLVRDFVLALVLISLAGLAAGVALRTSTVLLDLETEEARRPVVREHLRSMLRVAAGVGLVAAPLLGAAFGPQAFGTDSPHFDHRGASLAVSVVGLLLLVLAAVVFFRVDDRRGTASFSHDVWDALRGGAQPVPHRAGTGYFIALEGGDGAGKSTQAQALAEWIRSKGHEVVVTREPGGSAIGQRLRAMLLDVGNTGISHRAEALLYAADRAEHVDNVIRPALDRGAVVITDRYMDSSVAYQGAGRDLAASEVARVNRWATDGLVPDLTVLLDVDPAAARERFTEALDRLESEPEDFHARVRSGFLALAAADPVRYLVVNAAQSPGEVTTAIRHRLDRELPLSEQERVARIEQERLAREAEAHRIAEEARLKAEAERAEREKQAQLERLRMAEEEKAKALQAEEDRKAAEKARHAAEQARLAAEAEAARRAAAEQERREAEAAERRRIESEAARLAELERQRDERRAEERRRAEDALRRAEEARLAAAAGVTAAEAALGAEAPTREVPLAGGAGGAGAGGVDSGGDAGSGTGGAGAAAAVGDDADAGRDAGDAGRDTGDRRAGEEQVEDAVAEDPSEEGGSGDDGASGDGAPQSGAPQADASGVEAGAEAESAPASAPAAAPALGVAPDQPTQVITEEDRAEAVRRADEARAAELRATEARTAGSRAAGGDAETGSAADETAVIPRMPSGPPPQAPSAAAPPTNAPTAAPAASPAAPPAAPRRGRAVTPSARPTPPEERTAVLPQVPAAPSGGAEPPSDQHRLLPRSWRVARPKSGESVQEGSPDWLFRPEPGDEQPTRQLPQVERTTEMPLIDPAPAAPSAPPQRPGRYDWAEETPLDDLPSLTDELLGSRDEWSQWDGGDDESGGKGRKGKR
ncbi:dTMP kinase [Streptacidiphilus cavernicola]|uniref:Thymidylate kinase n=1 Tax=Streptacidiphilus cavernicola TaxID=3342716 RepID=A0ABV6VX96_9ACTN